MLQLRFNKIKLYNFGCYTTAELDLSNKGFCLVQGKNNCSSDNADSNGSGKSLLWNAICYAITGETINGLTKNLNNLLVTDPKMDVELSLSCNGHDYIIKRGQGPAKFLYLTKDEVDISGKTYTESLQRLNEELPELTKELVASTLILGQGMPNRFSSFSPSGRKELLEKLTKSDFMIEDIKARVQLRHTQLSEQIRELEDSALVINTKLTAESSNIALNTKALEELKQHNFEAELAQITEQLAQNTQQLTETRGQIDELTKKLDFDRAELLKISSAKTAQVQQEYSNYSINLSKYSTEHATAAAKAGAIEQEIKKLKTIKDVCPTCNQRIPGIQKPDTSGLEAELCKQNLLVEDLKKQVASCNLAHTTQSQEISKAFDAQISVTEGKVLQSTQAIAALDQTIQKLRAQNQAYEQQQVKLVTAQSLYVERVKKLTDEINASIAKQAEYTTKVTKLINAKEVLRSRLAILKKIDTLIKRDFRGYLLSTLIEQLNSKAKEFCQIVFGTRDLSVYLDGNALDIAYNGKLIDNLSGGEKTRVDLILQLAIRSILADYLGVQSNILVLDEVTDFLDKKSCKAVMKLLEAELNMTESVFIVSHRANELELPIDSEILIVKNESGTSYIA